MPNNKPISKFHFLLLLLLLLHLLLLFNSIEGGYVAKESRTWSTTKEKISHSSLSNINEGTRMKERRSSRRLMIGSTAPTCTYNECRKCRFKCRAEQVPVEGNDPINSAYHYRCVCHI